MLRTVSAVLQIVFWLVVCAGAWSLKTFNEILEDDDD